MLAGIARRRQFLPWRSKRWCAQTFPDEREYRGLVRLFPDLRLVYVARSGVTSVQARMNWLANRDRRDQNFANACRKWGAGIQRYRYVESARLATRVRFEDLTVRPDSELERLLRFLQLEASDRPAIFLKACLAASDPDLGDGFDENDPSAIDNLIYRSWSAEKQETFRTICSEPMASAGYGMPS